MIFLYNIRSYFYDKQLPTHDCYTDFLNLAFYKLIFFKFFCKPNHYLNADIAICSNILQMNKKIRKKHQTIERKAKTKTKPKSKLDPKPKSNSISQRLKLQIVSDLHLEFRPDDLNFLVPSAPVLCLLGDICVLGTNEDFAVYKKFIETIYEAYELIIHVPGNHEYYNKTQRGKDTNCTMEKINARLRQFAKTKKKLHILNNNMMRINVGTNKYCLIGTTMWTYVDPKNYKFIQESMNDYKYIHVRENGKTRKFQVSDMQKLHKKSISCVRRFITLASKTDDKCVLLTHHKIFRNIRKNSLQARVNSQTSSNIFSQAYESDLVDIFDKPIALVAYGHTHKAFNGKVNKIRTVSNPRGYPRERTKFNNAFSIFVP